MNEPYSGYNQEMWGDHYSELTDCYNKLMSVESENARLKEELETSTKLIAQIVGEKYLAEQALQKAEGERDEFMQWAVIKICKELGHQLIFKPLKEYTAHLYQQFTQSKQNGTDNKKAY